jgi:hypothetical protein
MTSCNNKKNEEESWNTFYTSIEEIKKKNEVQQESKSEIKSVEKSRGSEIINGKSTEIKGSSKDEFINSTEFPDFDSEYLWSLYNSNNDIYYMDFLNYYDQIAESDESGQFDAWHINEKIIMLAKTYSNLDDVKNQAINHISILGAQYRINAEVSGIKIKSSNEIFIENKTDRIVYKIHLINPINKLTDWYHYIFKGTITNIEKKDNTVFVTIENSTILIDEFI